MELLETSTTSCWPLKVGFEVETSRKVVFFKVCSVKVTSNCRVLIIYLLPECLMLMKNIKDYPWLDACKNDDYMINK